MTWQTAGVIALVAVAIFVRVGVPLLVQTARRRSVRAALGDPARITGLTEFAAANGLVYAALEDGSVSISGSWGGLRCAVSDQGGDIARTAIHVEAPAEQVEMWISPRVIRHGRFGPKGENWWNSADGFSAAFSVTGEGVLSAALVLTPEVRAYLLRTPKRGVHLTGRDVVSVLNDAPGAELVAAELDRLAGLVPLLPKDPLPPRTPAPDEEDDDWGPRRPRPLADADRLSDEIGL
ncbi:MAG: hypothetical protein V9E83_06740 [Baekduia sp.]